MGKAYLVPKRREMRRLDLFLTPPPNLTLSVQLKQQ